MIDKSISTRDGLPTQSLRSSVIKHLVEDGTDVALCTPMHVADIRRVPTGTLVEVCQACWNLSIGEWVKA
jgi:hypothetical protein